jgi:hypothetical protein
MGAVVTCVLIQRRPTRPNSQPLACVWGHSAFVSGYEWFAGGFRTTLFLRRSRQHPKPSCESVQGRTRVCERQRCRTFVRRAVSQQPHARQPFPARAGNLRKSVIANLSGTTTSSVAPKFHRLECAQAAERRAQVKITPQGAPINSYRGATRPRCPLTRFPKISV